ncbi:MAG: hypothetical protein QXU92_03675 [Candidatus Diapherotrites archaeon]
MRFWLVNHSWESFHRTQEYCGFVSQHERDKIQVGDKIIYFGQGLVFGLFEATALVENEFNGWVKKYPFQVKLKPIAITTKGLIAKPLESKILLQKMNGGSPNLVELTEQEFNRVKQTIDLKQKELVF